MFARAFEEDPHLPPEEWFLILAASHGIRFWIQRRKLAPFPSASGGKSENSILWRAHYPPRYIRCFVSLHHKRSPDRGQYLFLFPWWIETKQRIYLGG